MHYTLGLIYNPKNTQILLQLKDKPDWQHGRYNGIGGKVEQNETPDHAMLRKGIEEIGVEAAWTHKGQIKVNEHLIDLYKTNLSGTSIRYAIKHAQRNTNETLDLSWIDQMPENILSNLTYLVPMLADDKFELCSITLKERS